MNIIKTRFVTVCELLNSEYYIAVLEEEERYYTVSWTLDTEHCVPAVEGY